MRHASHLSKNEFDKLISVLVSPFFDVVLHDE